MKTVTKAKLRCPTCQSETQVEIPQHMCLAFYRCSGCKQIIGVPDDAKTCCVICAYSDAKCPYSTVK